MAEFSSLQCGLRCRTQTTCHLRSLWWCCGQQWVTGKHWNPLHFKLNSEVCQPDLHNYLVTQCAPVMYDQEGHDDIRLSILVTCHSVHLILVMSWPLASYGSTAAASLLSRSKVRAGAKNLPLDRTLASLMKLCIAVQKCCGTSSSQCGSTGNISWTPLQLCRSWRQPSTQLRAFLTASRNWRSSRKTLQRYATRLKPLCGYHIISSHFLSPFTWILHRGYILF